MKRALLLALLLAAPLVAQHPADQVFLQSLGHSGAYRSDVWITNATRDPLSVSLIFSPVNASEGDRHFPIVRRYPGVISLLPGEPGLEIADVFDRLGISGFGLVVFNACLAGADCTPNPATGLNPNYRDISVTSRVWSGTAGTRGESFPGVEWYGYISAADPESLRHVSIGDIKNTQQLRTNLMLANVSEWSSCEMFVILFDGLGNERARKSYHLRPLENIQLSTGVEFPELNAVNRLNRQPLISSPWFRIEQAGVTPTPQAAGAYCHNGCPAFLAQGVLVDSQTLGDGIALLRYEVVRGS